MVIYTVGQITRCRRGELTHGKPKGPRLHGSTHIHSDHRNMLPMMNRRGADNGVIPRDHGPPYGKVVDDGYDAVRNRLEVTSAGEPFVIDIHCRDILESEPVEGVSTVTSATAEIHDLRQLIDAKPSAQAYDCLRSGRAKIALECFDSIFLKVGRLQNIGELRICPGLAVDRKS